MAVEPGVDVVAAAEVAARIGGPLVQVADDVEDALGGSHVLPLSSHRNDRFVFCTCAPARSRYVWPSVAAAVAGEVRRVEGRDRRCRERERSDVDGRVRRGLGDVLGERSAHDRVGVVGAGEHGVLGGEAPRKEVDGEGRGHRWRARAAVVRDEGVVEGPRSRGRDNVSPTRYGFEVSPVTSKTTLAELKARVLAAEASGTNQAGRLVRSVQQSLRVEGYEVREEVLRLALERVRLHSSG